MRCAVPGCARPYAAKGYCHLHYNRWRRHGDPLTARRRCNPDATVAERLGLLVDSSGGPDACWPFTGATGRSGYGRVRVHGVSRSAHVWAYEEAFGPVPDGLLVRHHCDNRLCCNPSHLATGTHQDNMNDKVARGRQSRLAGEQSPTAILTEPQALSIRNRRRAGERSADLATEFGVSRSLVNSIATGKRWAHLEGVNS